LISVGEQLKKHDELIESAKSLEALATERRHAIEYKHYLESGEKEYLSSNS